jgi:MerR family transcriptional regulator, light-induced transcriptional regulator
MASAISHLTLGALFERARVAPPLGKKIVIACVEGEQHDLPARLASDLLEIHGFEVRFLGANVPHDELITLVRDERPDLIGLSVTMTFNVPSLREAVSRLRTVSAAPIFIGGHALLWSPSLQVELQVHAPGSSPDRILAMARELTGLSP